MRPLQGIKVIQMETITMQDVLVNPQQQANNCIVKLPHERDGDVFVTRMPITLSHCDLTPTVAADVQGAYECYFKSFRSK